MSLKGNEQSIALEGEKQQSNNENDEIMLAERTKD